MSLQTFAPSGFKQGQEAKFTSTLDIPTFDLGALDQLSKELIQIEDDKIKNIEENYNTVLDTKDTITGLDTGFKYGNDVIARVKGELGIDDKLFNLSMEELRDPFKARAIKSKLTNLLGNSEVKAVIAEGNHLKDFEKEIRKMERNNPGMANVAKKMYNMVKTGTPINGVIPSAYELNADNFKKVDISKLIQEEVDASDGNLSYEVNPNSPDGYLIFDKVSQKSYTPEQFAESVVSKYKDSPLIQNNLMAQLDPHKPVEEQIINDPEAVSKHLRQEALKVFGDGRQVVDTDIKEDKIGVDKARLETDIALDNAQTKNKAKLEDVKYTNDVNFENIKSRNEAEIARIKAGYQMQVDKAQAENDMEVDRVRTEGDVKVKQTEGAAVKYETEYRGKSSPNQFDFSPEGIDHRKISESEEKVVPAGEDSSREKGNGVYSTGDGGKSYGSKQMNGEVWSDFASILNSQLGLGFDNAKLKGTAAAKEENLRFIEAVIAQIGEPAFRAAEEKYLYETLYKPAINHAELVFGRTLPPEIRTFIADSANQHGKVNTKVINDAKLLMDNNYQVSVSNDTDVLMALTQARVDYVNTKPGRVKTSKMANDIIEGRIYPLQEGLAKSLVTPKSKNKGGSSSGGTFWSADEWKNNALNNKK